VLIARWVTRAARDADAPRATERETPGDWLSGVLVVGRGGARATPAEIDELERRFSTRFPRGYRELVTTLGGGTYADRLRPYLPARVARDTATCRALHREHWDAWAGGALSREGAERAIPVLDSVDGDLVVFDADDPDRLYLLASPRAGADEPNREIGRDLFEALDAALAEIEEEEVRLRLFERDVPRPSRLFTLADAGRAPSREEILARLRDTGLFAATLSDEEEPFFVSLVSAALGGRVIVEAGDETDDPPRVTVEIEPGTGDPGALLAALAELGFAEGSRSAGGKAGGR
jgi:hypothetical protein